MTKIIGMDLATRLYGRLRGYPDPETCWVWTGGTNAAGYGYIRIDGVMRRVHRVTYEEQRGPIPDDLQIDHLCRNKTCANPDHLEPVTGQVNSRRYTSTIQSCRNGHLLDRLDPRRGWRYCGQCARDHDRENHRRYRAQARG